MKIAVIGAGVIGVTSALELVSQGHDVVVFDKANGVAQEASFATAGFMGPGFVNSWATPGLPLQVFKKWLLGSNSLVLNGLFNTPFKWLWQWYQASHHPQHRMKLESLQRLAFYSQEVHLGLAEQFGLNFEHSNGYMLMCHSEKEFRALALPLELLKNNGMPYQTLAAQAAKALEPALADSQDFHSAVLFPNDGLGNCRLFALQAKQQASQLGADFRFGQEVLPLHPANPLLVRVKGGQESLFDHVVVCAGMHAQTVLKNLQIPLPVLGVNGYTLSAAVREALDAPVLGLIDVKRQISITRTGQRIRVSGIAEIGHQSPPHDASIALLYKVLNDWFPGAAKTQDSVQIWRGTRDTTTDGVPVIGHSGVKGVWLNVGHGNHGWATACGSARAIADMLSHRGCEIDLKGLGIERF